MMIILCLLPLALLPFITWRVLAISVLPLLFPKHSIEKREQKMQELPSPTKHFWLPLQLYCHKNSYQHFIQSHLQFAASDELLQKELQTRIIL
jgi:hypothetical protein